jgi:hypothetical protein
MMIFDPKGNINEVKESINQKKPKIIIKARISRAEIFAL